jgi:hypothetical protein
MHPITAIRMWEHGHHGTIYQDLTLRIPHWVQEESLLKISGMILAVGLMILMGLMITGDIQTGSSDILKLFDSPPVPKSPWAEIWKGMIA